MSNNKRNNRSTIKYPRSNDKWYKTLYNISLVYIQRLYNKDNYLFV